ncbi:MAG: hypothetical protein LCH36_10180 [Actinobacteria bacterium]|nr:hypothetical protein [Actinomycetota bacterium]
MIARALVAVGGADLSREARAAGGLEQLERKNYTGSGSDWESAKEDAKVPAADLVLHWVREV